MITNLECKNLEVESTHDPKSNEQKIRNEKKFPPNYSKWSSPEKRRLLNSVGLNVNKLKNLAYAHKHLHAHTSVSDPDPDPKIQDPSYFGKIQRSRSIYFYGWIQDPDPFFSIDGSRIQIQIRSFSVDGSRIQIH